MQKNRKKYFNHAFRFGSICGLITVIWFLLGYYTLWERGTYFGDIYFFINIALMSWMILQYKRENPETNLKFKHMAYMGMVFSLTVGVFYVVYICLRMFKLDPVLFENQMYEVLKLIQSSTGIDYTTVITPQNAPLFKISYVVSVFFANVINNMIYVLFVSLIFALNNSFFAKNKNTEQ